MLAVITSSSYFLFKSLSSNMFIILSSISGKCKPIIFPASLFEILLFVNLKSWAKGIAMNLIKTKKDVSIYVQKETF